MLVPQEMQMRKGPANVSVRTALETANVIPERTNVTVKTKPEAIPAITELVSISPSAIDLENSQMTTTQFPMYEGRGNEGSFSYQTPQVPLK